MEKPDLDKVIEKLEQVDIREWEVLDGAHTHQGPYFKLNRYGLTFLVGRPLNGPNSITIENHNRNVHIVYKRPSDKVNTFYYTLSKGVEQYQERDAVQRLSHILSEEDITKTSLEKVITRLKQIDIRAWKSKSFLDSICPELITEVSGITFSLTKGVIAGYGLKIRYNVQDKEKEFEIKYNKKTERKYIQNLIGDFYETIYKELKETNEKEFEENIKDLLSEEK